MDEFNQQQNNVVTQQSQNAGWRQGLAIASLILGILSIVLFITIIFPFVLGILAIVFGALSLKSKMKGMAIAGIVTGVIGLLLAILIIVMGIWGSYFSSLGKDQDNSQNISHSSNNSQSDSYDSNDSMETFYGDGFELTYSGLLWNPVTRERDNSDEIVHALEYALDETILMPSGVSGMLGRSTATRAQRDVLYMDFYELYESSDDVNTYIVGETETFEFLKDDIYYASYCIYGEDDDKLLFKTYVIASESDDTVVSFVVQTGFITEAEPDIPIMPLLRSITFTGRPASDDSYEQKVWESDDEYTIGDDTIPSLSQIMNDNNISHTYIEGEKTIGKMELPSILNYFEDPELVSVEIIEVTYNDVDDVWGAIDAYGRLLNESYDFYVTYPPTEYPDFGEDYRFCELIKKPDSDEAGIIYVAAIYSEDENIIKVQFGTIETSSIPNDGIGPLNLEAIEQSGI